MFSSGKKKCASSARWRTTRQQESSYPYLVSTFSVNNVSKYLNGGTEVQDIWFAFERIPT